MIEWIYKWVIGGNFSILREVEVFFLSNVESLDSIVYFCIMVVNEVFFWKNVGYISLGLKIIFGVYWFCYFFCFWILFKLF